MQIALCDDNKFFLRELREQLRTIPLVDGIHCFSCLEELRESVENGESYDAVLMDIDWQEEKTGIDAAAELYRLAPRTKIIYVTGYTDRFVQQVFLHRANLSGYLTKPVDRDLLVANLQKVADSLAGQDGDMLTVKAGGRLICIPLRDILYVESQGHSVRIHTPEETLSFREKLNGLLEKLPDCFCQCHKSFLVNMRQIRRFQYTGILLKNGETLPVSRARYAQTRENYFRFMGREF